MSTIAKPTPDAVQAQQRLAQLFRVWLREGRVHPLLHLMLKYRGCDPR